MRDNSSPADGDRPWYRARIWWPVEKVPVRLEVVHPRKLLVLEWALLRVVSGLETRLPMLEEVAEELGIGEAAFLRDTLREVVRLRALTPRLPGATWTDLPDLAFTATGRELFRRGLIEGEPAHPGEMLFFDALTDESCRAPPDNVRSPDRPFPAGAALPEPRVSVGLDRARDIVRALHGDVLRGGGELRSVEVRADPGPSIIWKPVTIDVHIDDGGRVELRDRDLTPAARAVLAAVDPVAEGLLPSARVTAGRGADSRSVRVALRIEEWHGLVAQTLPVAEVEAEMLRLIGSARREILLHAGWTSSAAVHARLMDAAQAGVKVAVIGTDEEGVLVLHEGAKPGLMVTFTARDVGPPALIVDARAGVVAAGVIVELGARRPVIELGGALREACAAQIRARLLAAIESRSPRSAVTADVPAVRLGRVPDVESAASMVMADRQLQLSIARMAILDDASSFAGCVALCVQLAVWPERIRVLVRLGALARGLVGGVAPELCLQPAREAWRALLDEHRRLHAPRWALDLLAGLAPEGVGADELIEVTLQRTGESVAPDPEEAFGRLVDLLHAVDGRWGAATCQASSAFRAARDNVLASSEVPLALRVSMAQRTLDAGGQRRWAAAELADLRVQVDADDGEAPAVLRAMAPLLDGATAASTLLSGGASLRQVVRVHALLRAAGYPDDVGYWQMRVERALTSRFDDAEETLATVKELLELALRAPQLSAVGRLWAARAVASIPRAETPEGLVDWLRDVESMRPLLPDFRARAAGEVQRLLRALQGVRAREPARWLEVERAWGRAGLARETLFGLVAGPPRSPAATGGDRSRSNRRKRR